MSFIEALIANPFLQAALLAGLAASVVSGVVGSYVVIKRIAFISGSIAHAVLGGIGFVIWLNRVHDVHWLSPLQGALIAALLSALAIGWVRVYSRQREDTLIAALWSSGMALGILFMAHSPGYSTELTNYLVGNILWVSKADLYRLWALDAAVLILVAIYYKRFLLLCFDEEQARLQGVPVRRLYLLLLALIAVTTVLLIHVVGIILVIALLTLPAAISKLFARRLSSVMICSVALCALLNLSGTLVAYRLDWPPGATIALLAAVAYLIALFARSLRPRARS